MVNLPYAPGTATATGNNAAGAATLNQDAGTITTQALTTAATGTCTLTLNCDQITPNSVLSIELANGTNSAGTPSVGLVTPSFASATMEIKNVHATVAFNGTIKVSFIVFN